jgi:hypothetical protein
VILIGRPHLADFWFDASELGLDASERMLE